MKIWCLFSQCNWVHQFNVPNYPPEARILATSASLSADEIETLAVSGAIEVKDRGTCKVEYIGGHFGVYQCSRCKDISIGAARDAEGRYQRPAEAEPAASRVEEILKRGGAPRMTFIYGSEEAIDMLATFCKTTRFELLARGIHGVPVHIMDADQARVLEHLGWTGHFLKG
ncbi:MAG TPA: hypothetical protein VLE97_01780 [Gaiellaceae bacterium]|nr:hypothetical protein [Gaiellaceae bacterium]